MATGELGSCPPELAWSTPSSLETGVAWLWPAVAVSLANSVISPSSVQTDKQTGNSHHKTTALAINYTHLHRNRQQTNNTRDILISEQKMLLHI